ncbi:MAG: transglutaminase family protein [Acidimicrobiales bacterium]|nr:transglutaminase family protein [Acidimicrobiales bacterium]
MRYRLRHETSYRYDNEVALAHNRAVLTPRPLRHQRLLHHELHTVPDTGYRDHVADAFGNRVTSFSIERPHRELSIVATSELVLDGGHGQLSLGGVQPWELCAEQVRRERSAERVYCHESPMVRIDAAVAAYAAPTFRAGRSLAEVASELTSRIYHDFAYRPGSTAIGTEVREVLERRTGVCQDFAHVALACLRSVGLAARYVSGFLETRPPAGQEKLVGADASHAWVSVRQLDGTWLDLDPTNDLVGPTSHVTLAWGRDYSDVAPLSGVIFAGRVSSSMRVAVDLTRIPDDGTAPASGFGGYGGYTGVDG